MMKGDLLYMKHPIREDLQEGNKFPDFTLPDSSKKEQKLSELVGKMPAALIFYRGYFCPKDRRQLTNYVEYLQPELRANYCSLICVSVDDPFTSMEVRNALAAEWTFLCDKDKKLLHELEMVDRKDKKHGEIFLPYTFILDSDLTIHKIYNGWWYVGRPTAEDLRQDFRELVRRRDDWFYSE